MPRSLPAGVEAGAARAGRRVLPRRRAAEDRAPPRYGRAARHHDERARHPRLPDPRARSRRASGPVAGSRDGFDGISSYQDEASNQDETCPCLHESGHDDQQLVRYLLRLLPDEDAERLDELSIADDEVAWRLRVVENDLVDAYVSGTLTGETLERFESFYLASERRRQKVKFAGSFLGSVDRGSAARIWMPGVVWGERPSRRSRGLVHAALESYGRIVPRSPAAWTLAAAAALLLMASGALLFQDMRLRNGLNEAQSGARGTRPPGARSRAAARRPACGQREAVRELARVRGSMAALGAAVAAAAPSPTGREPRHAAHHDCPRPAAADAGRRPDSPRSPCRRAPIASRSSCGSSRTASPAIRWR